MARQKLDELLEEDDDAGTDRTTRQGASAEEPAETETQEAEETIESVGATLDES